MSRKLNSYSELKKQRMKSRCSVESVKNLIRKQFRQKLNEVRNENLYNIRNLYTDLNNLKILKDTIKVEASGFTSTEIIEILEEVERDIELEYLKAEGDEYERDNNLIMEAILKDVKFCPICDKLLNQDKTYSICDQCSESFNVN